MRTIKTWQDVFDLFSAKTILESLVEHVEGLTICASWPFWIRLCLKAKACDNITSIFFIACAITHWAYVRVFDQRFLRR
jgi:hypothetical protein